MNRRQVLEMATSIVAIGALAMGGPSIAQAPMSPPPAAKPAAAPHAPPQYHSKAAAKGSPIGRSASGPVSGPEMANRIAEGVMSRLDAARDAHWHKGEYNHILNLYRMEIASDPHDLEAYANSGWLLWSMDRDPEAVALYTQGLKSNPNSFYMYDELGQYYAVHKRDWAKALTYYQKAASMKDCQPPTLHMLAHAYERVGNLQMAEATWRRAVAAPRNPNVGAAKRNLERVRALRKSKGA